MIDTKQLPVNAVQNQLAPCEGPKALSVPLRLDLGSEQILNYQNDELLRRFSTVQGIYIDNADNAEPLTVIAGVTNQRIICPANSQLYAPVLCGDPISLTFRSAGGVIVNVHLLNFPVAPGVWLIAP